MRRISLFLALVLNTSALAATTTVTNTNDSGAGSLRAAIAAAVDGDTIAFSNTTAGGATNFYDGAPRAVSLLSALPQLTKNIAINGPGAGALTVTRSDSAGSNFRIFIVNNGAPDQRQVFVTISGLTLSRGGVNTISNPPFPNNAGGCILNAYGTVTLSGLRFTNNGAPIGGAITSFGGNPLLVRGSTFDANTATNGGAIAVMDGDVTVSNCTFLNNSASTAGGATYTGNIGDFPRRSSITINNSTFQSNSAPSGSAIYNAIGSGNGYTSTSNIGSNIFNPAAGASSALAASGGNIVSLGYNLSSDSGGGYLSASTDQRNTNPAFGAQVTSGGQIYFPLLATSAAVDRGYNFSGAATDQANQPRTNDYYNATTATDGDDTDIGAIELQGTAPNQQSGPTYTVTNAATYNDGACSPTDCTLPEAILAANGYSNSHGSAATVGFSATSANGFTNFYDGMVHFITLTTALPSISGTVTIQGPGPNALFLLRSTVAGTPDFRIFYLHRVTGSGPTVALVGLRIINGKADYGGGILNDHGNLTVINCFFDSNNASSGGGGIFNFALSNTNGASLTVNDAVFIRNSAGVGGAIYSSSVQAFGDTSASLTNSTFASNSAGTGGAVAIAGNGLNAAIDSCTFTSNSAVNGAGLDNYGGRVTINRSTWAGNSATNNGGGISNRGYRILGSMFITNSVLYNNTAQAGGAILNDAYNSDSSFANLYMTNCTLSGNSASANGGGLYNHSYPENIEGYVTTGALAVINSCTFSGNSAPAGGSVIYNTGWPLNSNDLVYGSSGAGALVANTILNRGSGSGANVLDAAGNSVISQGYNLSSDNGAGVFTAASDHINTDPKLGPLQNNGGPTLTHALLADSPARDQGKDTTNAGQDQRGQSRPFNYGGIPNAAGGDGSDIGAFEDNDVLQENGNLVVNTTGDWDDGFCGVTDCTLREAINRANLSHSATTITFNLPAGAAHTIDLTTIADSTSGGSAFLLGSMTIQGPGANLLTLRRGGTTDYRLFRVGSGATVTISGLTISNGYLSTNMGGGIWNQGTLTLQGCAITNNYANSAGGIQTERSLTLDRCTVSGNSGSSGGGIISQTNLSGLTTIIRNSTISGNTAANYGGGLENTIGLTQILNSTITRNSAPEGFGSGVFSHFASNTRTEVYDSIIANNLSTDVDQVSGASSYLSQGHNLIGYGSGAGAFTAAGDTKFVTNPKLGPLANNGGGTLTHALLLGSPAINAGAAASVTTDQRGLLRESGGAVDIGAYELQPESYAFWSSYTFPLNAPGILTDPNADYDHDGIPNGLEQALGLDPKHPDAPNLALEYDIQNGYLVLQFERSITIDPAKLVGEQSLDLITWSSIGITYSNLGAASSDTELIQALIPISNAPKKFGRLRYTP